MGEIYGARAFHYRLNDAKLQAEHSPYEWQPDVNEARHVNMLQKNGGSIWNGTVEYGACEGVGKCWSCGFYAYYDGIMSYGGRDSVFGVVKGWGMTQIGTVGFRCSKAEIVAMYRPPQPDIHPATGWLKPVRWTQRNMWSPWWGAVNIGLFQFILATLSFTRIVGVIALLVLLPFMAFHLYCRTTMKYDGVKYRRLLTHGLRINYDLIAENYPNIKWFTNVHQMIKEYNLKTDASLAEMVAQYSHLL